VNLGNVASSKSSTSGNLSAMPSRGRFVSKREMCHAGICPVRVYGYPCIRDVLGRCRTCRTLRKMTPDGTIASYVNRPDTFVANCRTRQAEPSGRSIARNETPRAGAEEWYCCTAERFSTRNQAPPHVHRGAAKGTSETDERILGCEKEETVTHLHSTRVYFLDCDTQSPSLPLSSMR